MGRDSRISFEGAMFHITVRGNNRSDIFIDKRDYARFINILKERKRKYSFKLHCYVCMKNHFHLLIEISKTASISKIMQAINTSYSLYFNKKYERTGHVFEGRFHSKIIDKDSYLLELSRYIHLNPVRANIAKNVRDYKWSSYPAYCEYKDNNLNLVDKGFILAIISSGNEDVCNQVASYTNFVENQKSVSDTQSQS